MTLKHLWIAVLLLVLSAIPALAQDTSWWAYIYNGRDLVRVYQDGTTESFNVGLGADTFVGAQEFAFSTDGSRVAFCATTYPPMTGDIQPQPLTGVFLRDIVGQTNLLDLDMGTAIACRTGAEGMSPDGSLFAVGAINQFEGDPNADPTQPAWRLQVVDTATGSVAYELTNQSPAAISAFGETGGTTMPYIQHVDNSSVIFAPMPWFTEGFIDAAYRWDFGADTVELATGEQWEQFRFDTLDATGEQVWIAADPNLPALQPMGPMPAYNVVRVADSSGQVTTIYHNPNENPVEARFINNGQQVAIQLSQPFDESNPNAPIQYKWVAVDRAGNVTDLFIDTSFSYLFGAPDGYVRLVWDSRNQDPNNATFHLLYAANGETTELWSMAGSNDQFGSWELAWAAPMPAAEGLQPFIAFPL